VFAGELRETLDMLKNPLGNVRELLIQLIKALLALKTGKLKGKELAKAISNVWLQFQFGIMPLASDIDSLIDIINDKSKNIATRKNRFYGSAEASTTSVDNSAGTGLSAVYCRSEMNTTDRVECILHAGIIFRHSFSQLSEQSGAIQEFLNSSELPNTIWELTPFSFLIDYFTNISEIISSSTQSYADISYISESIVKTRTNVNSIGSVRSTDGYFTIMSSSPAVSRISTRTVARGASASAIPPLYVSLPGSSIQYENMAALLVKLFL
jgi:hypothetical protein